MRLRLPDRGEGGERGTIAVLVALLAFVFCAVAAVGVDVATQVREHQQMYDTIDAAAHAGAYLLPGSASDASTAVVANALANDPSAPTPSVALYCVVASLSGSVDNSQIPATCNPLSKRGGSSPNYTWTGSICNTMICSIPCLTTEVCNTVKVTGSKAVPYSFAPIFNVSQGSTGSVSSAACKGTCGTLPLNPMDIAVVADRTGSMSSSDVSTMITGIKGMFTVMTPSLQYVALGTIGRSKAGVTQTSCTGSPLGSTLKALTEPSTVITTGPWVPVPFSNDYLTAGTTTVNAGSTLVKGVECLRNQTGGTEGTQLASPLKYAARYLLGPSSPYDASTAYPASAPVRTGNIRKAIIFETDGAPNEKITTGGSTTLSTANDISSKTSAILTVPGSPTKYYFHGGQKACQNLLDVAENAKDEGILVVTIGFNLSGSKCDNHDQIQDNDNDDCRSTDEACDYDKYATPSLIMNVLSAAASDDPSGDPSAADSDCSDSTERADENADGDYFFCGGTGTDMAEIYKTALTQLNSQIRLIQMP